LDNATGFANEGVGTLVISDALYSSLVQSGLETASVVSIFVFNFIITYFFFKAIKTVNDVPNP
ncbi:hypothetical protein, partial [Eubacterium callanderi]|uniref:hypothetical protein n=1 Tax=Eubacterium callanderi TaxID=53442 RepID=UPI00210A35B1